jgi:CRISPR/Cas system CMR-associated protein Cmr5 small subunit
MNVYSFQAKYAEDAVRFVQAAKTDGYEHDYLGMAQRFPAMIHGSGVVAAFAFLQHKASKSEGQGIKKYMFNLLAISGQGTGSLKQVNSIPEHIVQTQQVQAAAALIKRFAEAMIEKPVPASAAVTEPNNAAG